MRTESGFEFSVKESCKDDYELIEELAALGQNDPVRLPRIIKRLIGEDGHARLKEHCRENGIVSAKKMSAEMMEIMNKANTEDQEIKN